MDYTSKTRDELISLCKERKIKGYSGKKRDDLIKLLTTSPKQDTGKFRTNTKDQFYTKATIAKTCIDTILALLPFTSKYLWIEPSAGNGAFLHSLSPAFEKVGLDIDPKAADIQEQDYLKWTPPKEKNIIIFGNPPFGRQSSLAKAFIGKSCEFAKVIAFILPKSFTKPSMFNAFDRKFHLISSSELAKNSFMINDSEYDVPCVFQIWQKKEMNRALEEKVNPQGFEYVKKTDSYDIAFRRVGGLAGKCYPNDGTDYSVQSHYFLKLDDTRKKDALIEKINKHTFPSNTVGPRSLSKTEANVVINRLIQSLSSS